MFHRLTRDHLRSLVDFTLVMSGWVVESLTNARTSGFSLGAGRFRQEGHLITGLNWGVHDAEFGRKTDHKHLLL